MKSRCANDETERTRTLVETALKKVPPDTVILNGRLLNVFTGELIDGQSIWIKGGRIAYVGPESDPPRDNHTAVIDGEGMTLLPGLIDGHTHVLFRTSTEELVKHAIAGGTTTVVTETIELATIVGKEGIDHLVRSLEDQPIRFYFTVPPLCGLTPSEEMKAPANEDIHELLNHPLCLGVGEIYWGNAFVEGAQGERVRELASLALASGRRVEGHTAGARGKKLQAYTCLGVSSCHEPVNEAEVLERLRLGYWVMIRQGAIRKELAGVKGIFDKDIDFRRLILSTDGMDPESLVEEGYLDAAVREALRLGVPPALVYRMVSLNVAEHFRLDHIIGSIAPGRMADIVLVNDPMEFTPRLVMCRGKILFQNGKRTVEPRKVTFPDHMFRTVKIPRYVFPSLPIEGKVRVMELVSRLVTQERIIVLDDPEVSDDIIMVLALNRLGDPGGFLGLLLGFGLREGACGTTMAWDTSAMIVVGRDELSIRTVVERLEEMGGGAVYAVADRVVADFSAPLCGVVSLKPVETVAEEIQRLEKCLQRAGVKWEKPLLTIDTLGTAAIPHLRVTQKGYVRLRDRKILSVEI